MQFSQVLLFSLVAAVSARGLPSRQNSASAGSCSTGTAQCCSTVQSGSEAKGTLALLGLNDIAGSIGLGCQQVPINVIGVAAAVQNQCKNTAVCCSGSEANGLIQTSCTPLSVN